jgi:glycerol-3-phosphate dehydrogenase subunit B
MRTTLVIGAGLSGLMGALALAEAGLQPLVLAKGAGGDPLDRRNYRCLGRR